MNIYLVMSEEEGRYLKSKGLIKWKDKDFNLRHRVNEYPKGTGLLCYSDGFMGNNSEGYDWIKYTYKDATILKNWKDDLDYHTTLLSETVHQPSSLGAYVDSFRCAHATNTYVPLFVRKKQEEERALAELVAQVKAKKERC